MKFIAVKTQGVKPAEVLTLPRGTRVFNTLESLARHQERHILFKDLYHYRVYECEDEDTFGLFVKRFTKRDTEFRLVDVWIHSGHRPFLDKV